MSGNSSPIHNQVDQYYQQLSTSGSTSEEYVGIKQGGDQIKTGYKKIEGASPLFGGFRVKEISEVECRLFVAKLQKIANSANRFCRENDIKTREISLEKDKQGITRDDTAACLRKLKNHPKYYHDLIVTMFENELSSSSSLGKPEEEIITRAIGSLAQKFGSLEQGRDFNPDSFKAALSVAKRTLAEKHKESRAVKAFCARAGDFVLPPPPLQISDKARITKKVLFNVRENILADQKRRHGYKQAGHLFDIFLGVLDYGARHEGKNTRWAEEMMCHMIDYVSLDDNEDDEGRKDSPVTILPGDVSILASYLSDCEKLFPGLDLDPLRRCLDGKQFGRFESLEQIMHEQVRDAVYKKTGDADLQLLDLPKLKCGETRAQWNQRIQTSTISKEYKQIINDFLLKRENRDGEIEDISDEVLDENPLIETVDREMMSMAGHVRGENSIKHVVRDSQVIEPLGHEHLRGRDLRYGQNSFKLDKKDIIWAAPSTDQPFPEFDINMNGCLETPESGFVHYYFFPKVDLGDYTQVGQLPYREVDILSYNQMINRLQGRDDEGNKVMIDFGGRSIPAGSDVHAAAKIVRHFGGVLVSRPIKQK